MKTKWKLFMLFICVLSKGAVKCFVESRAVPFSAGEELLELREKPSRKDRAGAHRSSLLSSGKTYHSKTLVTPLSMRPVQPGAGIQADAAKGPDVSVTCFPSDFVVRVNPAFYGLGADAQELTLGSSCKSNGVLKPQGDLLFKYSLTACDGVRELSHGYLIYKNVLHYEPSSKRFPSRAQQLSINIECHYRRDHSVHQLAVQPTWQTVLVRKNLKGRQMDFQLKLMEDSWKMPAKTQAYLLGQTVNLQVSAPHLLSGEKVYINSCYVTPTGSKSSLKYTIIDNYGCMLDSKQDPGASQFISRTDDTLRFSLKAFQFTADPDTEVSIHCKLLVTSEEPGPMYKSCTYKSHRWMALTGEDSLCECCESKCVTSKSRRALKEGSASSRPLLVSDQPHAADEGFIPAGPSASSWRRGDKENHYSNLYNHGNFWEKTNAGKYGKAAAEPKLVKFDYMKVLEEEMGQPEETNLADLKEDGSGDQEEDFQKIEEEVELESNEDEPSLNHQGSEGSNPTGKIEELITTEESSKEMLVTFEEKELHGCGSNKTMRTSDLPLNEDSLADEKTWYFTWR
ncbi:zona pellucida sperm-binding protein 3 [Oryzias melastigma]|uniref:Zona pellucida sperm-binding protein 3 n=1 Tax=Oryzias melastigma TaxID=30732 RepID=A0A3B3DQZ9_ORYME|nr:zona pellucida sperm-binding protein 3 [Oryzias melastigma]